MGRYRKIDTRIWNDAKFRAMSDGAKLTFLFLLTHPHLTALGAMRATLDGLAAELGWSSKAFREAFREALSKGIAEHDEAACYVGLPNFLRYNGPESPNVVRSWVQSFDLIPECSLKAELQKRAKAFAEGLGEGFRKAFAEIEEALPIPLAKGMPNQEPEQEPEPEQEQKEPLPPLPKADEGFARFWKAYPAGRKQSKARTRTAWGKAIAKADAETIIAAAVEYAASPVGQGEFVKAPETWLNGECWDDDRAAWQRRESKPAVANRMANLEPF